MPFDLRSIIQSIETRDIPLRGTTIRLRALSAATMVRIDSALPAPIAPDASEEKHPAFRAMRHEHYARRCALIVGVSADIVGADGATFEAVREDQAKVAAYADHILGILTEQEVMRLYKIVGEIGDSLASPDPNRMGSESRPGN